MSIKDRIAQFEGLSKNTPITSAPSKPVEVPKTFSQPQPVQPKPVVSPPTTSNSNNNNSKGNEIESPSIVKPSAAKMAWEAIAQQSVKQSPKKQTPSPTVKPNKVWPPPSSNVSSQNSKPQETSWVKNSPQVSENKPKQTVSNTVVDAPIVKPNKVWPPPTSTISAQTKPIQTPVPAKPNKVWPPVAESAPKPTQKPLENKEGVLSHNKLKQMFQKQSTGGMSMGAANRMSFPVQSNSIIAKVEQESPTKQAPASGQVQTGTVKGNTQKLNRFFQAQRQYQKAKVEEQKKENTEKPAWNPPKQDNPPFSQPKPVIVQENSHPSEESSGISFLPGPGPSNPTPAFNKPNPMVTPQMQKEQSGKQESLMVRLKKKKRAKARFSSSSED